MTDAQLHSVPISTPPPPVRTTVAAAQMKSLSRGRLRPPHPIAECSTTSSAAWHRENAAGAVKLHSVAAARDKEVHMVFHDGDEAGEYPPASSANEHAACWTAAAPTKSGVSMAGALAGSIDLYIREWK